MNDRDQHFEQGEAARVRARSSDADRRARHLLRCRIARIGVRPAALPARAAARLRAAGSAALLLVVLVALPLAGRRRRPRLATTISAEPGGATAVP